MSTRTSKVDANWFSISNNIIQLRAGTEGAETMGELAPGSVIRQIPDSPDTWDAYLKVCDNTNGLTFNDVVVRQGQENAIDCNNKATNCSFNGDIGLGGVKGGDQVVTVKGGCSKLTFSGTIYSQGTEAHVVVGAYADQSYDRCTDLDFTNLRHANGQPLTFILCRCDRVKLPPDAKVLKWKSACYWVYFWVKRAVVKLGLIGGK